MGTMNFIEQLSAVTLLIVFLFGVAFGMIGGAVHGSLSEDRKKTLLRVAPDLVSGGARVIFGVCTRDDGYMARLLPGGRVPRYGRGERNSDGSGTRGKDPKR
jgi:hypothetical protein